MALEAYEEHAVVKLVLAELPGVDPEDERFDAKMTVLLELIEHHVEEEGARRDSPPPGRLRLTSRRDRAPAVDGPRCR